MIVTKKLSPLFDLSNDDCSYWVKLWADSRASLTSMVYAWCWHVAHAGSTVGAVLTWSRDRDFRCGVHDDHVKRHRQCERSQFDITLCRDVPRTSRNMCKEGKASKSRSWCLEWIGSADLSPSRVSSSPVHSSSSHFVVFPVSGSFAKTSKEDVGRVQFSGIDMIKSGAFVQSFVGQRPATIYKADIIWSSRSRLIMFRLSARAGYGFMNVHIMRFGLSVLWFFSRSWMREGIGGENFPTKSGIEMKTAMDGMDEKRYVCALGNM